MGAQYRFTFSEEFLLTANLRYRRQLWWQRPFYGFKWLLVLILIGLGVICAVFGTVSLFIPFGAIAGGLFLGWPLDSWLLRRGFRKSPFHNDEITITLTDDGVHAVGKSSETRVGWASFTKARRFKDGLLLFQGPQLFNWLPDAAACEKSTRAEAERMVQLRIADVRDV
jgi:hypothetical protein